MPPPRIGDVLPLKRSEDSLISAAFDSYLTWFDKPLPALLRGRRGCDGLHCPKECFFHIARGLNSLIRVLRQARPDYALQRRR